jgi:hypothetical protein
LLAAEGRLPHKEGSIDLCSRNGKDGIFPKETILCWKYLSIGKELFVFFFMAEEFLEEFVTHYKSI